jgi:hypothetical protein
MRNSRQLRSEAEMLFDYFENFVDGDTNLRRYQQRKIIRDAISEMIQIGNLKLFVPYSENQHIEYRKRCQKILNAAFVRLEKITERRLKKEKKYRLTCKAA